MRFLRNDNFVDEVGGNCDGNQAIFYTDWTDFIGFQRILFDVIDSVEIPAE